MEKTIHFSFQKTFYVMACIALFITGLYYGSGLFIPLSFAILLSCILMPAVRWLVKKGIPNVWSITITFITLAGAIYGVIYLFSSQINKLISDFSNVAGEFDKLLQQAIDKYNEQLSFLPDLTMANIDDKALNLLNGEGGSMLGSALGTLSGTLTNIILALVLAFMILLYRKGIKHGILNFFPPQKQEPINNALQESQKVGMKYLSGLFKVIIILSLVNAGALYAIGVDYAWMFAILGGLLVVIPYVGSFLGAIFPTVYALATMDTKSALLVLGAFALIQVIEGNILTPKIVGDSTDVNPIVSISVLLIGGFIWGVPGMILGLPLTAMAKRIFKHLEELRPLAQLISSKVSENEFIISKDNKVLDQ